MRKLITMILGWSVVGMSYNGYAQNCIPVQNFNSSNYNHCGPSSGTTVTTAGSETGTDYFLVNDAGDTIDGPLAGTGNALDFNTGAIATTTLYDLYASRTGKALTFSGVNGEQVNVPNTAGSFGTGNFTVEAWIKTTSTKNMYFLACTNSTNGWRAQMTSGAVYFKVGTTATVASTITVNDGKWHHIAMERSATALSIFIDGVLNNSQAFANPNATTTGNLVIGGASASPTFAYEGAIDEVRTWYGNRTATELVDNLYTCPIAITLLSGFKFEEGTGADVSNYGNTGNGLMTNSSATLWTDGAERRHYMNNSWIAIIGSVPSAGVTHSGAPTFCNKDSLKLTAKADSNALSFNGTNQYVAFDYNLISLSASSFTIDTRINTTGVDEGLVLCSDGDSDWESGERSFYIDHNGYPTFVGYANGYIYSDQAVNDGQWHHIAVTWNVNEATGHIYIDGTDRSTAASDYAFNNSDVGSIFIGRPNHDENENYFSGKIQQLRFWNKACTYGQVLESMYSQAIDPATAGLKASFETQITAVKTLYVDAAQNYYFSILNNAAWNSATTVDSWNNQFNTNVVLYAKASNDYNVTIRNSISGCYGTSEDTTILMDLPSLNLNATTTDVCQGENTAVTLTLATDASAATLADQAQAKFGYYQIATPTSRIGQSFTAGKTGALATVEIRISSINSPGTDDVRLELFEGAGFGGTSLFLQEYVNVESNKFAAFDISGVEVVAGMVYTWALFPAGSTSQIYISHGQSSNDYVAGSYYAGNASDAGAAYASPDMSFKTTVTVPTSSSWNQGIVDGVSFVPTLTKEYKATVITGNGCVVKDSIEVRVNDCSATGVKNSSEATAVKAYPNPGTGVFTLSSSSYSDVTIQVYNALGEMIYGSILKGNTTMNLSSLENGIYIMKSIHSNGVSTQQLVIEK